MMVDVRTPSWHRLIDGAPDMTACLEENISKPPGVESISTLSTGTILPFPPDCKQYVCGSESSL